MNFLDKLYLAISLTKFIDKTNNESIDDIKSKLNYYYGYKGTNKNIEGEENNMNNNVKNEITIEKILECIGDSRATNLWNFRKYLDMVIDLDLLLEDAVDEFKVVVINKIMKGERLDNIQAAVIKHCMTVLIDKYEMQKAEPVNTKNEENCIDHIKLSDYIINKRYGVICNSIEALKIAMCAVEYACDNGDMLESEIDEYIDNINNQNIDNERYVLYFVDDTRYVALESVVCKQENAPHVYIIIDALSIDNEPTASVKVIDSPFKIMFDSELPKYIKRSPMLTHSSIRKIHTAIPHHTDIDYDTDQLKSLHGLDYPMFLKHVNLNVVERDPNSGMIKSDKELSVEDRFMNTLYMNHLISSIEKGDDKTTYYTDTDEICDLNEVAEYFKQIANVNISYPTCHQELPSTDKHIDCDDNILYTLKKHADDFWKKFDIYSGLEPMDFDGDSQPPKVEQIDLNQSIDYIRDAINCGDNDRLDQMTLSHKHIKSRNETDVTMDELKNIISNFYDKYKIYDSHSMSLRDFDGDELADMKLEDESVDGVKFNIVKSHSTMMQKHSGINIEIDLSQPNEVYNNEVEDIINEEEKGIYDRLYLHRVYPIHRKINKLKMKKFHNSKLDCHMITMDDILNYIDYDKCMVKGLVTVDKYKILQNKATITILNDLSRCMDYYSDCLTDNVIKLLDMYRTISK